MAGSPSFINRLNALRCRGFELRTREGTKEKPSAFPQVREAESPMIRVHLHLAPRSASSGSRLLPPPLRCYSRGPSRREP